MEAEKPSAKEAFAKMREQGFAMLGKLALEIERHKANLATAEAKRLAVLSDLDALDKTEGLL